VLKCLQEFQEACFLGVSMKSLWDTAGVWLGYTTDQTRVPAVPNFLHDFLRMFSLASQCTRYSMLMTSSWARPPTRLEYRLKRSLTFYSIVGLCLIFYRSFRRLFSLALQWKCYSATQGLVGPDHRPDKSTGSTCHNSWSDHWIVLKFLQEFSEAIFTVAMKLLLDADSLLFG